MGVFFINPVVSGNIPHFQESRSPMIVPFSLEKGARTLLAESLEVAVITAPIFFPAGEEGSLQDSLGNNLDNFL
jgi:hypothetical protein